MQSWCRHSSPLWSQRCAQVLWEDSGTHSSLHQTLCCHFDLWPQMQRHVCWVWRGETTRAVWEGVWETSGVWTRVQGEVWSAMSLQSVMWDNLWPQQVSAPVCRGLCSMSRTLSQVIKNDLSIGWKNFNLLSHPNATLAPQARQARASLKIYDTMWH